MNFKILTIPALAAAVAIAPITQASAHDGWHHGLRGGPLFGVLALGTAAVVGVAAIATAPIRAVADAGPAYYPDEPVYVPQPAPTYYAPPQAYYQPPQPVYYSAPVYYAPRPRVVYAAPRYYYR